jgi:ABC-type antimicrobial peptide transport system ATPase subunit
MAQSSLSSTLKITQIFNNPLKINHNFNKLNMPQSSLSSTLKITQIFNNPFKINHNFNKLINLTWLNPHYPQV